MSEPAVDTRPWWKVCPYDRDSLRLFALAFVVMTIVWTVTGWAYVHWVEPTMIGQAETDLATWLESARTSGRNDLAALGSFPSNIPVKIGLMVVLAALLPSVLKRWHDWAFLLGALLLEVSVYGLSSYLVGRPRPPVERLAEAPTESWPSGHVAAALTAYFGLAMIVGWHTSSSKVRVSARVVAVLIVVAMVISRLYLGMHYLSDVLGGIALGATSLLVAERIVARGCASTGSDCPPQTQSLSGRSPVSVA